MRTTNIAPRIALLALTVIGTPFVGGSLARAQEAGESAQVEEVVVQATRSGRKVEDETIRVEVLNKEEVEEKLLMRPGNIGMMVAETGGVRVQVTSPALGSSDIRMQGMSGRYTQLLSDGLPLYGGQTSAIGLLQIPPTDLGQVEIIKGAASALYGPSALGGVINLISRRPAPEAEGELTLNATTHNGQDVTAYGSAPASEDWRYSVVGGLHRQTRVDLDGDGWADIPGYERWTLRPRLFWTGKNGGKALITIGAMGETRTGGTLPGSTTPDGQPFPQDQDTRRLDAGLVSEFPLEGIGTLHLRGSAMTQTNNQRFGSVIQDDRHETVFSEGSFSGKSGGTSWLGGVAFQADTFRSKNYPSFDYSYTTPALFGQIEHDLRKGLTLAGSGRLDVHSRYGSHFSPRLSLLYKPGPWTIRASVGSGFFAPTPFVEKIEAAGLSRLEPLGGLRAETAQTASLDGGYKAGPLEVSLTLFASNIDHAVQVQDVGPDRVRLINAAGATRNQGAEFRLRYRWNDLSLTGSYVYVDATEPDPQATGRRAVPLTPRNSAGVVGAWEKEGKGKIGLEAYYTGVQSLDENPYRSESRPYWELGALVEHQFGKYMVFLNVEDLLDVRQTHYDRLVLPRRAPDGEWTVDVWAPMEGRVANLGVRVKF